MKQINLIITITAFILISSGCAKKDHDHGHSHNGHIHDGHSHNTPKKDPGPNGGRILKTMTPALEFFVLEDRRVQITALNDLKPIPVNEQTATLRAVIETTQPRLSLPKKGIL